MKTNHPAHGPVSLERLHQIREILSKASAQSDGGNLGYAMADAVKVIDGVLAARKAGLEPVAWVRYCSDGTVDGPLLNYQIDDCRKSTWTPLYAAPQLPQLPQLVPEHLAAVATLESKGYTWHGGQLWKPPIGKAPAYITVEQPAVVDADDNFYSWFGREWHEHYQHNQYTTAAKQMLGVMAESAWKAARSAAMLHGKSDGKPELTVWYGAMPETNGKTNWTAILHRKGQQIWEGITIDRSEYPDRVRYEADRMRYLIGELPDEPDILSYDADAHSGYVKPGNSPVTQDGWIPVSERMPERDIDVQVFCADKKEQMVGYMERNETEGWFRFASLPNGGGVYCKPTHWMPLPAEPQQEVKP